ncbi:hypothetical protein BC831DRAFT_472068 [Entophlyctis helioformis]|nr:hypothetical protein BC831DRAFT_472068 [Entophlyctis helioformis]
MKVLCRAVHMRLSAFVEGNNSMPHEQAGFCRGEEAVAQVCALVDIIQRRRAHKLSTHADLIDIKKADWHAAVEAVANGHGIHRLACCQSQCGQGHRQAAPADTACKSWWHGRRSCCSLPWQGLPALNSRSFPLWLPTTTTATIAMDSTPKNSVLTTHSSAITVAVADKTAGSGYTLSWRDINYAIKGRPILNGMSGHVAPGSVVAILGASGAGKSTLLDILSGRRRPDAGEVLVNGRNDIRMKHVSRYCAQDDALLGSLTVYETLYYASCFNLPKDTTAADRKQRIDALLREFGIDEVRDTIVGTPLIKGCSGGQQRRVSVASQIIGNEGGILFLDEPTSGLDSVSATRVVESLCNIAQHQRATVLATIHQPSTETFNKFSHVLILGQGSTVFFGPREEAIAFFESIGKPVPVHANPSDVYLEWVNVDFAADREASKAEVRDIAHQFTRSEYNADLMASIEAAVSNSKSSTLFAESFAGYTNDIMYQSATLTSRSFLNARKNLLSYWVRVAMYIGLAILMGTTWLRLGTHQSSIQSRLGAIFFSVAFLSFMSVAGIPAILEERLVFIRERDNGLYTTGAYLLSNFIVSLPFIAIITVSFSLIAYWLMGFQAAAANFLLFNLILFLALLAAEAQTVFVSAAIPIFVAALAVGAFANGLWMVVLGFFVPRLQMPAFYRYTFHYIDYQKYAFDALMKNEFGKDIRFDCDRIPNSDSCFCNFPTSNTTVCSFDGAEVLKTYNQEDVNFYICAGALLAITLAFKLCTYLVMRPRA